MLNDALRNPATHRRHARSAVALTLASALLGVPLALTPASPALAQSRPTNLADLVDQVAEAVVNISATTAFRGGNGRSVFAAAKTGIIGLTHALALEWAPYGITVNAISPGVFRSGGRTTGAMIPLGRTGDPREVGYLTQFLASPASDFITGQHIGIDGGRSVSM